MNYLRLFVFDVLSVFVSFYIFGETDHLCQDFFFYVFVFFLNAF